MSAKELSDTTLDPKKRTLLQVRVDNPLDTDKVLQEMMGKDPSPRFKLVMERSAEADSLDL
ncbi:MAG: hypothetical protein V3W41_00245 [Planctomycetota bacterium]